MSPRTLLVQTGRNFVLTAFIAGVYFVFGLIGLLFRFGDPIGILMPAAGFSLVAVLLLGIRVAPGLVIGSFCVNAWAFDFKQGYIGFYIASALGSALAACVGAAVIRKKIGFPNPLVDIKSIIAFMLVGGLLGSMITATAAAPSMLYSGIIGLEDIPAAWFSWWVADVIGVVIFSPIMLSFFAQPQPVWGRRRLTVGYPVMLAFALVFLLFTYMKDAEQKKNLTFLREKAAFLSKAIENRIRLDTYALGNIKNYLPAVTSVAPEVYSSFVRQGLLLFKEIQSVAWINFKEEDAQKNRFVTMLDRQSPNKLDALKNIPPEVKRKWREAASPEAEVLVSNDGALRFVVPIVDGISRRHDIQGVIIANVLVERLVQQALAGLDASHCSMVISAGLIPGTDKAKTIYSNLTDQTIPAYATVDIPVAGHSWRINFHHDWDKAWPVDDRPVQWVIFDGLCSVGLLGIVLLYLTGRYFRAEALIAERTNTLEELRVSAESANNAKNQFLAKISHELRTPLNGITGFTQLLEKRPSLTAEDKKHVAIIKQCSDNLLKLINDILDISAIESQQVKMDVGEFDYQALLDDTCTIFKFRADEKGLKLVFNNTCPHRKFIGDEKRIRQIIANLVDNAIKYTNQGGITIDSSYEQGKLKFSVSDSGCGIGKSNLDRIFSPFVQVNSGNFSREGVGLGLTITKELVHLMDGELKVSSELGSGATFTITLPLPVSLHAQGKPYLSGNEEGTKYNGIRVLVVDDSEINLLLLVCLLEQLGCKVESVNSGHGALQLIEHNFYDLALIDINMPVMDGYELVKRLRSRQLLLCIVAVSAYADEERISEALKYGFDAYLTKPIQESDLIEVIKPLKKIKAIE